MRFTNDGYFTTSIITCPNTAIYDYSIIWRANGKIILSTYTKYGAYIKRIITTPILRDYTNYPSLKYNSYLATYFAKNIVNHPYFRGNVLYLLCQAQGVLDYCNHQARKRFRLYYYPSFIKTIPPKPSLKFTIHTPQISQSEFTSDICPLSHAPPGS